MQQTFHFRDGVVQLLFDMAGSVQCVVSGGHCPIAVEASTVTSAIFVIATGPSTGIDGTGSVSLGPTDLKGGRGRVTAETAGPFSLFFHPPLSWVLFTTAPLKLFFPSVDTDNLHKP